MLAPPSPDTDSTATVVVLTLASFMQVVGGHLTVAALRAC